MDKKRPKAIIPKTGIFHRVEMAAHDVARESRSNYRKKKYF